MSQFNDSVQSTPSSAVGWSPAREHFGHRYSVRHDRLKTPDVVSFSVIGGNLGAVVNVLGAGEESRVAAAEIAAAFEAIVVPVVDPKLTDTFKAAIKERLANPWEWVEVGDRIQITDYAAQYRLTVREVSEEYLVGDDYECRIEEGDDWSGPLHVVGAWDIHAIDPTSIEILDTCQDCGKSLLPTQDVVQGAWHESCD